MAIDILKQQEISIAFLENENDEILFIQNECKKLNIEAIVSNDHTFILGLCEKDSISVLVSDYKMPVKDGITFMEEVRKINNRIILFLNTGFSISEQSDEYKRCRTAGIEIKKKLDGFENLINNVLLKFKLNNRAPSLTDYQLPTSISEVLNNSSVVTKSTDIDLMKETILFLARDLIEDLELLPNQNAIVYVGNTSYTTAELLLHIKELTPIGLEHIRYWFEGLDLLNEERNEY